VTDPAGSPIERPSLEPVGVQAIMALIPHRFPMLLVDRVANRSSPDISRAARSCPAS
jgi:3-hydroxymyristoyl/3-hydroxydecanoyl-(acyl carrier protein) dehydratase